MAVVQAYGAIWQAMEGIISVTISLQFWQDAR
jgi:hypothetical protein